MRRWLFECGAGGYAARWQNVTGGSGEAEQPWHKLWTPRRLLNRVSARFSDKAAGKRAEAGILYWFAIRAQDIGDDNVSEDRMQVEVAAQAGALLGEGYH